MEISFHCTQTSRNHRAFLDSIAKDLGVKNFEDWYGVTREEIATRGGTTLLQQYGDSVYELISKIYPEFADWKPWKFVKLPRHYWDNEENGRKALESVAKELGIKEV